MILLILLLNLLLNFSDPINDGYGNSSLAQPTDIIYRSVNAIDIIDFEIKNSSKLAFSISFSDLNRAPDLKNGFSLAIIEAYFEDEPKSKRSNQLLPGSGMRLADTESWHYAFQITADYLKVFENTASGITDISKKYIVELAIDGNTINISTDIPKKRNLQSYLMAGNYTPFNATGWKEITNYPNPWSYSSLTQSKPVIDLFAETIDLQKQAINSGILKAVQPSKDAKNLWRWLMIWGLALAIIGFFAKFLAKTKVTAMNSNATNLASRARAATNIKDPNTIDSEQIESILLGKLDININDYEKTIDFEETLDNEIELKLDSEILEQNPDKSQEAIPESRVLAPLSLDKLDFNLKEANTSKQESSKNPNRPKKRDKLKVHNLSDDAKKQDINKKQSKKIKKQKNKKNNAKKSLKVIPTQESDSQSQIDIPALRIEQPITGQTAANENPNYSLGDSFWDNFDNARDVSWKPKK